MKPTPQMLKVRDIRAQIENMDNETNVWVRDAEGYLYVGFHVEVDRDGDLVISAMTEDQFDDTY